MSWRSHYLIKCGEINHLKKKEIHFVPIVIIVELLRSEFSLPLVVGVGGGVVGGKGRRVAVFTLCIQEEEEEKQSREES